jgi:hypothetical protein
MNTLRNVMPVAKSLMEVVQKLAKVILGSVFMMGRAIM